MYSDIHYYSFTPFSFYLRTFSSVMMVFWGFMIYIGPCHCIYLFLYSDFQYVSLTPFLFLFQDIQQCYGGPFGAYSIHWFLSLYISFCVVTFIISQVRNLASSTLLMVFVCAASFTWLSCLHWLAEIIFQLMFSLYTCSFAFCRCGWQPCWCAAKVCIFHWGSMFDQHLYCNMHTMPWVLHRKFLFSEFNPLLFHAWCYSFCL